MLRLSLFLGLLLTQGALCQTARTWTDTKGRSIQAEFVGLKDQLVVLRLPSGQEVSFPLVQLSAEDQKVAREQQAALPAQAAETGRPRSWPAEVEVPARSIEIAAVEEKPVEKRCVYQSEAFSFTAEDKLAVSVMKEIARTFEATRSLALALPWGLDPKPGPGQERFQAKFYENRESYVRDGGPVNSGGVYMSRDRIFRIPFESLGLEMRGKTWYKNDNYRNDTVIHEITHQMMHDYLPFLPKWVIEGSAEYTEMLPYKAGRFLCSAHERGLKEHLAENARRGIGLADLSELDSHLKMTRETWDSRSLGVSLRGNSEQAKLYFRSAILVYFFCHLDGDGKGTRFMAYLDRISTARRAWDAFFANPAVKYDKATGRYSWNPAEVTRPAMDQDESYGLEQLGILLADRSPEQLETAVLEGLKKIGIK
jgi:hypothetical protein